MAYNKKEILTNNLLAIQKMFEYKGTDKIPTDEDIKILSRFNGYGGIDAIAKDPNDDNQWNNSNKHLRELVKNTFDTIYSSNLTFNLKKIYSNSIKESILTQFFTPKEIADTIVKTLKKIEDTNFKFEKILDPSAGMSIFTQNFDNVEVTSLDKDPIVSSIQKIIYSKDQKKKYSRKSFEEYSIDDKNFGEYDLIISNIPFGDIKVHDKTFQESNNKVLLDSQKYIHNYFFAKGLSSIKEGGILCFITSTGFLDSKNNQDLREFISHNANIISTIRFPKGMFSDNAGTETQSDLVILQKNTQKAKLDIDFISTMTMMRNDIQFNINSKILLEKDNTIASKINIGKNMYGKYDYILTFDGNNNDIASILESKLSKDLQKIDRNLFISNEEEIMQEEIPINNNNNISETQEIYDKENIMDLIPNIGETKDIPLIQKMAYIKLTDKSKNYVAYLLEYDPINYNALVLQSVEQQKQGMLFTENNWEQDFINLKENYTLEWEEIEPQYLFLINELDAYISEYIPKIPNKIYDTYNQIEKKHDNELLILKANNKEAFIIGEKNCDIIDRYTEYSSQIYKVGENISSRVNLLSIKPSEINNLSNILTINNIKHIYTNIYDVNLLQESKITQNDDISNNIIEDNSIEETKEPKPNKQIISIQNIPDKIEYPKENIMPTDIDGMHKIFQYKNIECVGVIKDINKEQTIFIVDRELTTNPKKNVIFKDYIHLRDIYDALYYSEYTNKTPDNEKRNELNIRFDEFVKKHGNFRKRTIKNIIKEDIKSFIIETLEKQNDNGKFIKSDIFFHPTIISNKDIKIETSEDALMQSLNTKGKIDLEYMVSILPNKNIEEIKEDLKDVIFYDPRPSEKGYYTKEKFLSGNIYDTINDIKFYSTNLYDKPKEVENTLKLLENNIPEIIKFDDIGVSLGERWIPSYIYEQFANSLFGYDTINVYYNSEEEEFEVKSKSKGKYLYGNGLSSWDKLSYVHVYEDVDGVPKKKRIYRADEILGFALQDKIEEVKKEVYNKNEIDPKTGNYKIEKVQDVEAMRALRNLVNEFKSLFKQYTINHLDQKTKEELEYIYNKKYNAYPKISFDGQFQRFDDINFNNLGYNDLYNSQKDAIWRIKIKGGGIIDHEVGGGKTMIMCVAAHEMKRLGLVQKPLIIALKANVQDIVETYKKAYPMDRILYTNNKLLNQDNRLRTLSLLMNNNWDCVIMTHEQFEHITPNPEIEEEILRQELDDNFRNIELNKKNNISIKQLIKSQKKITDKLSIVQEQIKNRSDENIDFGMLGIDHIFVDESHKYKNLLYQTRHSRVAGLGNTNGSQRATVMLTAIRTIQKNTGNDYGVTFLSGTTITNSLTELYSLFKYMIPNELERMTIKNFDSWAAVFATKSADYELSVTNQLQEKERFREFNKIPELSAMYTHVADHKSINSIGIDRPKKNVKLIDIEPSEDQKLLNKRIVEFVSSGDPSFLGEDIKYTDRQTTAKMLLATNMSRKASLDMRMIDPSYEDNPNNKLSVCAKNIAEYYNKYDKYKGTQFVFSDLGTPKSETKDQTAKKENIEDEELKDDEKELFSSPFNPYVELKRKLVEDYNIPHHEIRFIHEFKSEEQREKFCEDFNNGKIRVIIGSTTKLGTGINAQERAVAIHHLDVPWTPASIEQRNGRAVRKGNKIAKLYADNKVDILVYGVKNTLDAFCWNAIERKDLFIKQIKDNNIKNRTIDESKMDTKGEGLSPKEICALLSGNEDYKNLIVKEKEYEKLISEKNYFYKQKADQLNAIKRIVNNPLSTKKKTPEEIVEYNSMRMTQTQRDWEIFNSRIQKNVDGQIINKLSINGLSENADNNQIKMKLIDIYQQSRTKGEYLQIGEIYQFPICVKTTEYENFLGDKFLSNNKEIINEFFIKGTQQQEKTPIYYKVNNRGIASDSKIVANYFLKTITEEIPKVTKNHKELMEKAIPYINEYKNIEKEQWNKDNLLNSIQEEILELQKKLNENNKKTNTQDKEQFKEYCFIKDNERRERFKEKNKQENINNTKKGRII